MGGFLGLGHSSEKTDRSTQLEAQKGQWNIFNWALPEGQKGVAQSGQTLDQAKAYWQKLLTAGRTDTTQMAAPAINAAQAQADAQRKSAAEMGTARGGGTAAPQREAGAETAKTIDDIVTQQLFGGREKGAEGLQKVAGMEMSQALSMLGLSQEAIAQIMNNATESRALSFKINQAVQEQWGSAIGMALSAI
jgi:hypothetical protein